MPIESNQGKVDMRVLYAKAVFGQEEKDAVMRSMDNGWLASGPLVSQFEQEVAGRFGKKHGIAVNSGSSANLMGIKSLKMPEGSEVITPACTFATTVSEIVNNRLTPVFVDSVVGRYVMNEDLVEDAVTDKTKAILVPQLIGGVADMRKLKDIADRRNLALFSDECDAFAPTLDGKTTASYADVATTSFYGSHIITALGTGGMVMTDRDDLKDRLVTLKDWGRVGNDSEKFEDRFNFDLDGIPYDSKFLYSELGYNLKMNESSAAFGLEQLKKLPQFLEQRRKNHDTLTKYFKNYEEFFTLPTVIEGADTNWLAYALTIKEDAPFNRYDLLKYLDSSGIQVRVLFSGNITRHPVYKANGFNWRAATDLTESDKMMANGFLIGAHHGMGEPETDYVQEVAESFLHKF